MGGRALHAYRKGVEQRTSYRPAGYDQSVLTVDTGNATGALRLYERAGYTVTDTAVVCTKPLA